MDHMHHKKMTHQFLDVFENFSASNGRNRHGTEDRYRFF